MFKPILLLIISNLFMTVAWYWHLRFKSTPILIVILISWFFAFFEYCFQVPANRIGHGLLTASQLKVIQEIISLSVFAGFSVFYLGESIRWNYVVAMILLIIATYIILKY